MAELESKLSRSTLVLIVNVCLLLKDENKCRVCSFVHLLLKTSFYIKLYSTISIQECVGNGIIIVIIFVRTEGLIKMNNFSWGILSWSKLWCLPIPQNRCQSGSNKRINHRYLNMCLYIVLVSISRWYGGNGPFKKEIKTIKNFFPTFIFSFSTPGQLDHVKSA